MLLFFSMCSLQSEAPSNLYVYFKFLHIFTPERFLDLTFILLQHNSLKRLIVKAIFFLTQLKIDVTEPSIYNPLTPFFRVLLWPLQLLHNLFPSVSLMKTPYSSLNKACF